MVRPKAGAYFVSVKMLFLLLASGAFVCGCHTRTEYRNAGGAYTYDTYEVGSGAMVQTNNRGGAGMPPSIHWDYVPTVEVVTPPPSAVVVPPP
jgi:hypothetical protein